MTAYHQVEANIYKTYLLVAIFLVFIIGLGWLLSYLWDSPWVLYLAVAFSFFWSFISYWYSDKMVLSLAGASPVSKESYPELYRLVENLCLTAGLPLPKIYLINDPSPNAFATGRDKNHSAVCFTTGLLEKVEKVELEGVVAHELSHIQNRDTLLATLIVVLVGAVSLLANWFSRSFYWRNSERREDNFNGLLALLGLIFIILSPIIATLFQLAISRKREFLADASAALLTRYPEGLIRALLKIDADKTPVKRANSVTAHLYIADPLKKKKMSWFEKLWLTHPPIEERVKALQNMAL